MNVAHTFRSMSDAWQLVALLLVVIEGVCVAKAVHAIRGGS